MKILFVSMTSIHATRWIENLKDTSDQLYWFDVLDRGKMETLEKVHQFTDWKKRKIPYVPGEHFLYKKFPSLYNGLQPFLEVTANEKLEKIIQEIQPDVIHSFEMQNCGYPILKTMNRHSTIKWIYSCWGNDLFYYQNFKTHKAKIKVFLRRVNFLHTDCQRDFEIAKTLGFKGKHLGIIPGGSGYDLKTLQKYKRSHLERKIILVKGYQHMFGRGLNVVKALKEIQSDLKDCEVVIFGAHSSVMGYISQNRLPFKSYGRHGLEHGELLRLMGQSLMYIGNSISDGMPNTLLEAMIMGIFPIQSNPGGATAEIIVDGENGFLIQNPESIEEIKSLILKALHNPEIIEKAIEINSNLAINKLGFDKNKEKIIAIYKSLNKCE